MYDTPIQTDEELAAQMLHFVTLILDHFKPGAVPLTTEQQCRFIDMTHRWADKLAHNEPFLRLHALQAFRDYVDHLATPIPSACPPPKPPRPRSRSKS